MQRFIVVLLLQVLAVPIDAVTLRYDFEFLFSGTVLNDQLGTGFAPGDAVIFSLEIDSEMDVQPAGNNGVYPLTGLSMSFPFGVYTADAGADLGGGQIQAFNQSPGSPDIVGANLPSETLLVPGELNGVPTVYVGDSALLSLVDSSGTVLTDDTAPTSLSPGDFSSIFGPTVSQDWLFDVGGSTFFFRGPLDLTSINIVVVPEPTTGLLLALGLVGLSVGRSRLGSPSH